MKRYALLACLLASTAWGQAPTVRQDFQPLAPVTVVRPNGTRIPYGLGASTDAARGIALYNAQTAATSGDVIETSGGVFDLAATSNVGKIGVSYNFAPGTTVKKSATSTGGDLSCVIADKNDGTVILTGVVGGGADIISNSANNQTAVCIRVNNPNSNVTINANRIHQTNATGSVYACEVGAGNLSLNVAKDVTSVSYDCFILSGTAASSTGQIRADEIIAEDNPIEYDGGTFYFKARRLETVGVGSSGCVTLSGLGDGKLTVEGAQMTMAETGVGFYTISSQSGAAVADFIDCHVFGAVQCGGTTTMLLDNCAIDCSGEAKPPLLIASNNCTLDNCRIVMKSTETYWVSAATAKTLKIRGSLSVTDETGANRIADVDPDVTLDWNGKTNDSAKLAGTTPTTPALTALALADPAADRIMFWDDSAGAFTHLTVGSGLSIADTTIAASGGGGGAPDGATYIVQTPDGTLSAEQALSSLATGLVKNTTSTGVLSIAAAGTDYVVPDAELTALAGLTSAANKFPYFTGSGTATVGDVSAFALTFLDDAAASNVRSTLGLAGMAVQSSSSVSISGGTIDGVDLGATTPATGTFTELYSGGSTNVDQVSIVNHSLTGSAANELIDLSTGWNTSGTPTAVKLNVTDTASNAASLLMDLQVGASSKFKVRKDGKTSIPSNVTVFISPDLDTTAMTTGDGKGMYFRVPSKLDGSNLVGVAAACNTASSSGIPTFQLRRKRSGSDVDMLSTKVTIDATETDSADAVAPAVINTSNDDVATGDRIYFDCDVAGTGTEGVAIEMTFQLP